MILAIIVYMALVVVQSLGCVWLFATPWTAALQAALPFAVSHILLKLMSIELVMPSNHLVLCHPLLFLPSGFPSIRVFSNEQLFASGVHIYPELNSIKIIAQHMKGYYFINTTMRPV